MSENQSNERSTFDRMVSEISDSERKVMLSKVKRESIDEEPSTPEKKAIKENFRNTLSLRMRQENFFIRLWVKIKSALLGLAAEDIYNSSIVARIARDIERGFPGYIDYHHTLLLAAFYEKLVQLKNAQEFFKPYMEFYDRNSGRFYFFLGSYILKESTEKAMAESDPYQYPFTKNLTKEARFSLIQKMDQVLDSLPEYPRAQMYTAVKSVEWLLAFSKMYLDDIICSFAGVQKECEFSMARVDFAQISKIMSAVNVCDTETLQALFTFYQQENPSEQQSGDALNDFVSRAENELSMISSFTQSVPIKELAKVVFNNSLFECGIFSGGEDWFVRYKAQWKINFDARWASWMRDYNKYRLKIKLKSYFDCPFIPLFPVRPWENLWGDLTFAYDLTLGFVWYFFMELLSDYTDTLKILMLEGDFAIKENAVQYTDVMNEIKRVVSDLELLKSDLSVQGETGQEFAKLIKMQSSKQSVRESIQGLLDDVYQKTSLIVDSFGNICRTLKSIFDAVINGVESDDYGPVTNFMKIHGRENRAFRERLSLVAAIFEHGYEILQEVEAIDSAG